jgi:hypothetical protein
MASTKAVGPDTKKSGWLRSGTCCLIKALSIRPVASPQSGVGRATVWSTCRGGILERVLLISDLA